MLVGVGITRVVRGSHQSDRRHSSEHDTRTRSSVDMGVGDRP
jgi:hypothetical protein